MQLPEEAMWPRLSYTARGVNSTHYLVDISWTPPIGMYEIILHTRANKIRVPLFIYIFLHVIVTNLHTHYTTVLHI